jgi:hypothetical protein
MTPEDALKEVVGVNEQEAIDFLNLNDIIYRVSSRNGRGNILTMDFKYERVNLSINEGRVTHARLG